MTNPKNKQRWEGNYFAAMLGDIGTLVKMLQYGH